MLTSLEAALLAGILSGCGALYLIDSSRPEKATAASGTRSTANPKITKMIIWRLPSSARFNETGGYTLALARKLTEAPCLCLRLFHSMLPVVLR
jgi:hypothetical protein